MSLDKAIEHGKEHRDKYRGSKAIDRSCRNHGSCSWCRDGRLHQDSRERERIEDMEKVVIMGEPRYMTHDQAEEYAAWIKEQGYRLYPMTEEQRKRYYDEEWS